MIELHSPNSDFLSAWERVAIARHASRPTTVDYIAGLFDSFVWLHGDRSYADDGAMVGGIGMLDKMPVTVVGTEKGHTTKDRIARNFGMPHPEGYRKALRLMQQAEKFNRPVITFVDTAGAFPGKGSEERGIVQAIAQNLMEMSNLKVPIITVLLGEGGGSGALALAMCDTLMMLEHAYYSVITPEACASILWKQRHRASDAANALRLTAEDLEEHGIVDRIISEPAGGAHVNPIAAIESLRQPLVQTLHRLSGLDQQLLVERRMNRLRRVGNVACVEMETMEMK